MWKGSGKGRGASMKGAPCPPLEVHRANGRSMENVSELLPATPSIDQFGRIMANVAAPAFLLGAVAAFISVVVSRINRVIDRSQFIHGIAEGDPSRSFLKDDLPRLGRRAAP